jgi:hypothetical protein
MGVALLGGVLGQEQIRILDRYFDRIIIATDFDDKNSPSHKKPVCKRCLKLEFKECQGHNPGRDLGMKIAEALPYKEILWACYSHTEVYPGRKKDIGVLNDAETVKVINGALPHFEYLLLDLY